LHLEFMEQTIQKNLEFAYINSSTTSIRLVSDRYFIKNALRCLVDNAVKYTFSGQIQLGYYVDHVRNNAVFFIEDTGIGIPKESQKFIFDKFYQVDSSLSRKFEGGGLGLTMVKEVSKILKGEIEVNSIPGVGTCIKLIIPLQHSFRQNDIPISSKAIQTEQPKKKVLHILIAEDEEINLFLLEEILMREKFSVTCVRDGEEAVNYVANNKDIDVILMDIKMPVLDGIEATKMIKQIAPDIPVIAQTAFTSQDHGGRIDGAGFASIINKPVNHFELIEHIKLVSMHSPN
jgi:CheY-like chemotaxis protein